MAAGDSPALVQGFYKLPSAGRLDSPFDFAQGRLEQLSPRVCPYSIVDPSGWYLYFFPSQNTAETVPSPSCASAAKIAGMVFLWNGSFFTITSLNGKLMMMNLAFGVSARQASGPALDHQQHQSPRRRIFRGKLGRNLGISIAEVCVVGVNHLVIIFRLIKQWVGASCRNYNILDAIAIQIGRERGRPRHKLAGRPKLLLDEAVVHGRFVLGGSLGRRLNYRLTRLLGLSIQKKRDS